MEWSIVLIWMFGGLFLLFATGLPVAFSFMLMNLIATYILMDGQGGFLQIILNTANSIASFTLLPIPLFVLMGEILWHSGSGARAIDVLDKMLGRLPGRLSFLSVISGVIFASVSGSNVANTALLGSVLAEPMADKGYKKEMILGPIIGSGGLAMMIPPSTLGVICATIAMISVGKLLIALIIPGFLLASLYAVYILVRCTLQPELAPRYEHAPVPFSEKLMDFVKYLLPLGVIILLTVGTLFLGIATPTESASLGCLASCVLGYFHGRFTWVKQSVISALKITVMALTVVGAAATFSQLLAFSGASRGMLLALGDFNISPIWIVIMMQIALLILGGPMEEISLLMVALPIYMPIIQNLGFDPVWFGVLVILNMEVAILSPPFGMVLFVMKGVASKDTTMLDIYKSVLPFMGLQILAMILLMVFPQLALWLPSMMTVAK